VDTTAATKMVLKTTATNQDVELAMINGNQSGFIKYLASDNSVLILIIFKDIFLELVLRKF
jgi:hypothetical protein